MLKKVLFLVAVIGAINFFCTRSLAAPCSGTDPVVENRVWAIAGEWDYLFNRDLESSDTTEGKITVSNTVYGKFIFKPSKYLSLYGKIGACTFETELDMTTGKTLEEEYDTGLFTGGGGRLVCELGPKFTAAVDNQFSWWKSDIKDATYGGVDATSALNDITAWEYQVSAILSYKIDWEKLIHPVHGGYPKLIPYAGAKYAHLEMDSEVTVSGPGFSVTPTADRENEHKFGVVCGLDFDLLDLGGFYFNIEGRFLDETAISGYVSYNF